MLVYVLGARITALDSVARPIGALLVPIDANLAGYLKAVWPELFGFIFDVWPNSCWCMSLGPAYLTVSRIM